MKNKIKQTGSLAFALFFFFTMQIEAQTSEQELVYIEIEVKGLACPFCAYGLEKKLKETEGVKAIEINVEKGLVFMSVPNNQKPAKEKLEKIVTDAGFTPSNIIFSEKPFKLKNDE